MDAELEKLVEAGKLTTKSAGQLEKLKPGTFCLHKSWGFGRVREWNLLLNQIVIDFTTKKFHAMQAQYAAENLTPLAPEHFLVRKATDIGSIKKLARENPVALVQNILESLDGKASAHQIGEWLIGDVFTEAEWKRWWESTRKALRASGGFSIPAKKTDPIEIRGEGVSHADELLAAFNKAKQPKQQIAAFEQIIKSYEQFKEPEKQLQPIIVAIENSAARNQKLHPELAFELIIARDDLLARVASLHTTHIGLTLSKLIVEEEKRLTSILPNLPAAKEKRVLQALPAALGAAWTERALRLMETSHSRMVAQIPRILNETGQHAELRTMLERSIREHSATSEMLIWLCGEKKNWGDLITPDLLWAILAALEREQHSSTGRASRLLKAVVDDRELLGDIFKKVDVGLARDAMRRLQVTPLFDELTKRSLLARMVKEIVKVKIPENTKEIAIARSYGDLSENFEFKAAKQMQSVLMRRKADLEQMLHDARGTSFENVDTSRVSIGTIVTLRNAETNNEETYTVLGAWDGDPDRHIISYQTAIGQALLGHEVAETISLNTEDSVAQFIIVSIQPAPPDQTPPAPELPSESAVEAAVAE
jgi:transcription elongation GreA/GreB family factor